MNLMQNSTELDKIVEIFCQLVVVEGRSILIEIEAASAFVRMLNSIKVTTTSFGTWQYVDTNKDGIIEIPHIFYNIPETVVDVEQANDHVIRYIFHLTQQTDEVIDFVDFHIKEQDVSGYLKEKFKECNTFKT